MSGWLQALETRHLADLTAAETARALRALSSCYVERRAKLASGGALDSAGKRAAFALFYAPLHFLVTREIVRALASRERAPNAPVEARHASGAATDVLQVTTILDLGCGTGAAGAAWALEADRCTVRGIDRHPWVVAEANWSYGVLGVSGRAASGDIDRVPLKAGPGDAILAAYTVNELPQPTRDGLLPRLLEAHQRGARVLVVEPIARKIMGWWHRWETDVTAAGGTCDEWRFAIALPERQRQLGRAAGLDPRELTARSFWL
ncbi:MAG: methyltransferase domain-containing protein [Acidobacteriota bacterium]